MDTSRQRYEVEATGWQRGLYDDIKRTFRAPFVNWIFRTTMANHPEFLRYAWGQVKPVFDTRDVARFAASYRDAVLSELEGERALPVYRREDLGLEPAAYRELRGQVETFDVVGPRLAVLFELVDRALHDGSVGASPAQHHAATAPFPDELDGSRGLPPTMIAAGEVPDELSETVYKIEEFHGLDDGLPSIYRCLAQWPDYLRTAWGDLDPILAGDSFANACDRVSDLTGEFVDTTPYRPCLGRDALADVGLSDEEIDDVADLFRSFNTGPVATVLPMLPVYATTLDAGGYRSIELIE